MKGKNQYQVVIVLAPKLESKARETALKAITGWVNDAGVKVTKTDEQGLRDLAYSIKGHLKGDFVVMDTASETAIQLKELSLFLNREPSIIRYLVSKK